MVTLKPLWKSKPKINQWIKFPNHPKKQLLAVYFVARNQINNYRNFSKSNLIIKLSDSKKLNYNQLIKKIIMVKKNLNIFVKKIDHSKVSTILKNL